MRVQLDFARPIRADRVFVNVVRLPCLKFLRDPTGWGFQRRQPGKLSLLGFEQESIFSLAQGVIQRDLEFSPRVKF